MLMLEADRLVETTAFVAIEPHAGVIPETRSRTEAVTSLFAGMFILPFRNSHATVSGCFAVLYRPVMLSCVPSVSDRAGPWMGAGQRKAEGGQRTDLRK